MGIKHMTIGECLRLRAEKTPAKVAIEYREERYSWQMVDELSDGIAVRLSRLGMKKGELAGIWSVNHPDFILTFLALCKLGVVPVLINIYYKEHELNQIIRYTNMKYILYGQSSQKYDFQAMITELKQNADCPVRHWLSVGHQEVDKQKLRIDTPVLPEDTACMMFTSGTTGHPKGVMLSHYSLMNSGISTAEGMGWKEGDKQLLAVPLFHCFGITSGLLASIYAGCTIGVIEYFKTKEVLGYVQKYKSTVLNGVPSMFLALIRNPEFSAYDTSSLQNGIIAGAPVSPGEYQRICQALPGFDLRQSYGQTETSPCVTLIGKEDPESKKSRSVGRRIPHVAVRIWDVQENQEAKPGISGEIQVQGYNVMQGYYQLPEETAKVLTVDGWLRTGDLGYLDEDDYLYIAGRIKDMIIRAGENIMPGEIEELILQTGLVQSVKVVGIRAEVVQEKIVACIIPACDVTFNEELLVDFLRPRIAHYKIPCHFLVFADFPRTASGKLATARLKAEAEALIKKNQEDMGL